MAEKLMIVMVNTDPSDPAELGAPFFQATVEHALAHPELKDRFRAYLKSLDP
jgi:hypothetical protein